MTLLGALCGALVGLGLILTLAGIRGVDVDASPRGMWRRHLARLELSATRFALTVLASLLVWLLTGWPVAAAAALALGFALPTVTGSNRERRVPLAKTEAAAAWAEMLRDTLAGGQGLAASIDSTARAAPRAIRPQVMELAAALRYSTDRDRELRRFAAAVDDPTADRVVAGLLLHRGRRLGEMLGAIAQSAREHAQMRLRVESGRSRLRWTARFVCLVTAGMALVLAVFDHGYLAPYGSPAGQLMLVVVVSCFGAGLWWLGRIANEGSPPRLLADDLDADAGEKP